MSKIQSLAPARMWRAFLERDPGFDGLFLAGVRTTGIFCRVTCPARRPLRRNVVFFSGPAQAQSAGFRACKRCKPLEQKPELVRRLCELVEHSGAARIGEKQLVQLGVDPSTARRQFQRHFGQSFQAWQRAQRLGAGLRSLQRGSRVLEAQLASGFESASGFRSAIERHFGEAPARAARSSSLCVRWVDSPLGTLLLGADSDGLRLVEFAVEQRLAREIAELRESLGAVLVQSRNAHLAAAEKQLGQYFAGERERFELELAPIGTDFERRVWSELRRIPFGQTRAYAEVAARIGRAGAQRAVGTANGRNRLAIVIPCHRVIRGDGTLSGYGGGVARKRWLLEHEQRALAR
ncbi:MAG: methylated-DNA--[protein]-cysteine S-methyltransferase [Planctomycetes bacterium]|nr:methylated-DNA--[protein]-cysteine S-methyltransferase [Planctomycetota bacterium]